MDLGNVELDSTVLQYVDDILICSTTEEECRKDSVKMLTVLAENGYKVDKEKLQYCQEQVLYIGQIISQKGRNIAPQRAQAIKNTPQPQTIRELQQSLGLCNYCRAWVFDYSTYIKPLLAALREAERGVKKLGWTREMTDAFNELKEAISTAPVLATPNYKINFTSSHIVMVQ
ncbi:uncharacterized protein [Ambystoma mexicanum]|uniref:uncharacterized protein n=1 Tax=Ambystoma mexicanum TaxID=8296 RepID=UPI0037E6F7D2